MSRCLDTNSPNYQQKKHAEDDKEIMNIDIGA